MPPEYDFDHPVGGVRDGKLFQQLVSQPRQLLAPNAVQPADHPDVLAAGEQFVDSGYLTGEPHAAAHLVRLATDVVAGHPGRPAGRLGQRRHHPHGGGLARTVGTEQAEHRARRHREADPVDGWFVDCRAAEPLDQVNGLDRGCHVTDRIGRGRQRAIGFVHAPTQRRPSGYTR